MFRPLALALTVSLGTVGQALAQGAPIETLFSATTVAERDAALAAVQDAAADDANAAFAAGAHKAFAALEDFEQGLYRYGFQTPRVMLLPLLRVPVPENPAPETLTYEAWRGLLQDLDAGLAGAIEALDALPADADASFVADLRSVRLDMNGDGALDEAESVGSLLAALANPRQRVVQNRDTPADTEVPPPVFRFDRADAYWLQGYANFLRANAKLWLAHDFSTTFDVSFQAFFPGTGMQIDLPANDRADNLLERMRRVDSAEEREELRKEYMELPEAERRRLSEQARDRQNSEMGNIFDLVSFIHSINWPVVDADARRAARAHLLEVVRLSRLNWQAIKAETDNDREWLPGPQQAGRHPLTTLTITDETVENWHEVLGVMERVLKGEALLPHMRFPGYGVNMRRLFDEPTPFDLVLTITGPGALPYLETGEILDTRAWRDTMRAFGRNNFFSYAVWIN